MLVILRSFSTKSEAEMAQSILEGAGIKAVVTGTNVGLGGMSAVKLQVDVKDQEEAAKILDAPAVQPE